MMWKAVAAVTVAAAAAAAGAQDAAIFSKAINQPGVSYSVYGPSQTAKMVRDTKVVGGQALRIQIAAPGAQPYAIGASAPLSKPVVQGHRIVVAFWARAPKLAGEQTTPIPSFGLNGPAPGYLPIVSGSAQIGAEWKLFTARGTAPAAFAADQASVSLHLGAAKAVIDLGPVFVIDLDAPAAAAG